MDCIFCKIVNGEMSSYTIYEDNLIICFLDIRPDTNGHLLIIPKKHYRDLFDIDKDVLYHILNKVECFNKILKEKLKIDGLTLIQNNGDVQEVKHFHLHLKPYYLEKQKIIDVETIYTILKGA